MSVQLHFEPTGEGRVLCKRSRYGLDPWSAYKGGPDLDAPHISGKTWEALIDEIRAQEE